MDSNTPIGEVLKKVVLDVFEQMYFMFPQEIGMEDASKMEGGEVFTASVGVKSGGLEFVIAGAESLCRGMAGNMFGEETELSQQDVEDVVREAANIIMGNLINERGFPGEVSPDIPVDRKGMDINMQSKRNQINLFFDVDKQLLSVHMKGVAAS